MLTEPHIDRDTIIQKAEHAYGFTIADISFIPVGEASWGYKIITDQNERYFLKIHTALDHSDVRFNLTYRLFNECGIKQITHPLPTALGSLIFYIDKYPCALFNFIDGKIAADHEFSKEQYFKLGQILATIHQTKNVITDFEIREQFHYKNMNRLINNMEFAKSIKYDSVTFAQEAAQLLLSHERKIRQRMNELNKRSVSLNRQQLEFVICHGEPHQWNTMFDTTGQVYIIDWDDSVFAPKEKDLRMVKDNPEVLQGYANITGDSTLNQEVLTYYDMEWNLSEIDAWSNDIFFANRNDTQNRYYLKQLIEVLHELTHKNY